MDYLAEQLKKARNEKGVSLAEAAEATKIKIEYLRSLEEGDYLHLPPRTYVKGFLKIYGHYLALDYSLLLQFYDESFQSQEPQVVFSEPKPDSPPFLPGLRWKPLLTAFGVLAGLVFLIWGGIILFQGIESSQKAAAAFLQIDDPYAPGTLEKIPVADLE